MKWRPINTAPTDGTEILGYLSGGSYRVIKFEGYWASWINFDYDVVDPSHWMPLPKPPNDS